MKLIRFDDTFHYSLNVIYANSIPAIPLFTYQFLVFNDKYNSKVDIPCTGLSTAWTREALWVLVR